MYASAQTTAMPCVFIFNPSISKCNRLMQYYSTEHDLAMRGLKLGGAS